MRTASIAGMVFAAGVIGCGDAPLTMGVLPDTASRADTMQTVQAFGQYTLAPFDSVKPATTVATADGSFIRVATSSKNDWVGTINGRLAMWPASASAPTYMFRADTSPQLTAIRVNTRLEVVLRPSLHSGNVYMWRDGVLRDLGYALLTDVGPFNNRGYLAIQSTDTYGLFTIVPSPFGPDQAVSTRVKGDCARDGRHATVLALNDANEVLAAVEKHPPPVYGNGTMWIAFGTTGDWRGVPCQDLDSTLVAQLPITSLYGAVLFSVLGPSGLIGGARMGSFPTAVLTDGKHIAAIDDLLANNTGSRPWHVTQVISIDDVGVITARAFQNPDPTTRFVKLTPKP